MSQGATAITQKRGKCMRLAFVLCLFLVGCANAPEKLTTDVYIKFDPYNTKAVMLIQTNKGAYTIESGDIFVCRPIKASKEGDQVCTFYIKNI